MAIVKVTTIDNSEVHINTSFILSFKLLDLVGPDRGRQIYSMRMSNKEQYLLNGNHEDTKNLIEEIERCKLKRTKLHLWLNEERSEKVERHRLRAEKLSKTEITNSQVVYAMIDIASAMMDSNLSKEELIALIRSQDER